MKKPFIDFRQQRDFGETLNATFAFFSQNVGKMGKAMLFYTSPFLLIQGIARVYFDLNFSDLTGILFKKGLGVFFTGYTLATCVLLLTGLLSNLMANLTVYSYIYLYFEKGKDRFTLEDVWRNIKHNFMRVLIASFITGMIILSGIIMCGVPGVYLYVSTSFLIIIMIYEGKGFKSAFKRTFVLTHYHWWAVFLTLLVIFIILGILSLVFTIPLAIINSFYNLNTLNPTDENEWMKSFVIALTMLSTLASGFLNSILYIGLSFQYFSVIEKKESPRLIKDIEAMDEA